MRALVHCLAVCVALILGSCAVWPAREAPQVTVAGIEPLDGQGLELRMLVKLRVLNPNDLPIDYDGVYVKLTVLDRTFATGASDAKGTIPRFGESVVEVPVSISMIDVALQALGMLDRGPPESIPYSLEGGLNSPTLGSTRFRTQGVLRLPAGT